MAREFTKVTKVGLDAIFVAASVFGGLRGSNGGPREIAITKKNKHSIKVACRRLGEMISHDIQSSTGNDYATTKGVVAHDNMYFVHTTTLCYPNYTYSLRHNQLRGLPSQVLTDSSESSRPQHPHHPCSGDQSFFGSKHQIQSPSGLLNLTCRDHLLPIIGAQCKKP